MDEEARVLRALRSGEPDAANRLLELCWNVPTALEKKLKRALSPDEIDVEVEDAILDVASKRAAHFDPTHEGASLVAWVTQRAHWRCLDRLRKEYQQAREVVSDLATLKSERVGPRELAEQRDLLERIMAFVESLPSPQREVMRAYLASDAHPGFAELAALLKITRANAEKLAQLGREAIRRRFG